MTPPAPSSRWPSAPGTVRVIDEKTVYLRMPPTFMESETCLMVLRNLMRQAYDRETGVESTVPDIPMPTVVEPSPVEAPSFGDGRRDKGRGRDGGRRGISTPTATLSGKRVNPAPMPHTPRPTERPASPPQPAPQSPPAAAQKGLKSVAADLEKLVSLRDMGILTEEEFQAARRRLVNSRT